jgi:hypothetical protein
LRLPWQYPDPSEFVVQYMVEVVAGTPAWLGADTVKAAAATVAERANVIDLCIGESPRWFTDR